MERSPVDLIPKPHLLGGLVIALAAFACLIASSLALEQDRLGTRFAEMSDDISHHVEQQLRTREMALDSFGHYLSLQPSFDLRSARRFAHSLHRDNAELYMFAIATRVAASDRERFERQMRQTESRSFSIHPIGQAKPGADAASLPDHFPVVLLEPELPEARALLGLDLAQESSALSGQLADSVAPEGVSRPISIEGGRGFLLYRGITPRFSNGGVYGEQFSHYALLVVRAAALLPAWLEDVPGVDVQLIHPEAALGTRGIMAERVSEPVRPLPLVHFSTRRSILVGGEPLQLEIRYHPGWGALDLWHLAGLLVAALLLLVQALWIVLRVRRSRLRLMEQQQSLYDKAHFDHLTGLPNTNLLLDRLEQAIRSAQRTSSRVAVFFLDLDDFKKVNDRWGHDIGDQLLIQIGVRLRESLRSEDTVARIHGDEFVIMIPVLDGELQLTRVRDKLSLLFEMPFRVGDIELVQSGSIGLAVYPDDAEDSEGLLGLADRQMYQYKQARIDQGQNPGRAVG